ncbi:hypothetical protein JKP88DRAFT_349367 [Tribonema minus]|uniref:phosphoribosylformylglycinamidine cyclo-ligase n=1 Tax=Tribonema minus TaxID=303371 RepID=A0A836CEA2_9STRA|nr:hypothetical protein JKP88DRAFT_349367 [Tribonema minus]
MVSVNFEQDLPQYNTQQGMHISDAVVPGDNAIVTSPVSMWLDGLDMALMRLKTCADAAPHLPDIAGISVSGQQHGTVYWRVGASYHLQQLAHASPRLTLTEALAGCFARRDCPIWADSSTVEQCAALEAALGGAAALAAATGSAAYPRFSGNQIARVAARESRAWGQCERVSLVSSFVACALTGAYAPIDRSDAAGMNLMDIATREWHAGAVAATRAEGLAAKLGPLVDSHAVVGTLNEFFASKYGLPRGCPVVAGSGDNPCSMAAMGLTGEGGEEIAVSLGTSDTVMGVTHAAVIPQPEGHVMVSALDPAASFAMLVYKNGGVTRQRMRDEHAGGDWAAFEELLAGSPPGNDGVMGLFLDLPEITPQVERVGRFFASAAAPSSILTETTSLSAATFARALVEGRFLSMRARLTRMGIGPAQRVLAMGGASASAAMMQVLADVFASPVYVGAVPDAAVVGAALRAKHGVLSQRAGRLLPFSSILGSFDTRGLKVVATPDAKASATYQAMQKPYLELERAVQTSADKAQADPCLGGFGSSFDLKAAGYAGRDTLLVGMVDGVGTKLKIAQAVNNHRSIGIDLVAMCANDMVAQGAEPLFFLDYYATSALSVEDTAVVVDGIAEGCRIAKCALVGGETAQMPSMYGSGEYNIAGFLVGAATQRTVMPHNIHAGDVLLGLPSSGVHSNGFSIIRKIIEVEGLDLAAPAPFSPGQSLADALLTPTRIYAQQVLALLDENLLSAAAHVSKGGVLEHLARILPEDLVASIDADAAGWTLPPVFQWIMEAGSLEQKELLQVFNCGVGMILVTSPAKLTRVHEVLAAAGEASVMVLGRIQQRPSSFCPQVIVYGKQLCPPPQGADGDAHAQHQHITYSSSGVNLDAMRMLVDKRIKPACASTKRPGCDKLSATRGRGGLFDLSKAGYSAQDVVLVGAAEGVGTKLRVAQAVGDHSGVGIDLVAMCVNNLVAQGAEPLFFLDFYATGVLQVDQAAAVVQSMAEGCKLARCGLIDGETSEMPSMYAQVKTTYDLAGLAVGCAARGALLPQGIAAGNVILGVPSAGLHCNGFSLVRKALEDEGVAYGDAAPWDAATTTAASLLTPARIYVKSLLPVVRSGSVTAAAHVATGGVTDNLKRPLPAALGAEVDLSGWRLPAVFGWLRDATGMSTEEMLNTFNCGIGFLLVVPEDKVGRVKALLTECGEKQVFVLGKIVAREQDGGPQLVYKGSLSV